MKSNLLPSLVALSLLALPIAGCEQSSSSRTASENIEDEAGEMEQALRETTDEVRAQMDEMGEEVSSAVEQAENDSAQEMEELEESAENL